MSWYKVIAKCLLIFSLSALVFSCAKSSGPATPASPVKAVKQQESVSSLLADIFSLEKRLITENKDAVQKKYRQQITAHPNVAKYEILQAWSIPQNEERMNQWGKLRQKYPQNDYIELGRAEVFAAWKMKHECKSILDKIDNKSPVVGFRHRVYGFLFYQKGELDQAVTYYTKAVETFPQDYRSHSSLATIYMKQQKIDLAKKAFQQCAELAPSLYEPHFQLAKIYEKQGNKDAQIEALKMAFKADNQNFEVAQLLGNLFLEKKEWPESIKYFEKALKIKPDWPSIHAHLAKLYRALNKPEEELIQLEKVLEINPNQLDVLARFSQVHFQRGNLDVAMDNFKDILNAQEGNLMALHGVAKIYHRWNKYRQAIEYYRLYFKVEKDKQLLESERKAYQKILGQIKYQPDTLKGKTLQKAYRVLVGSLKQLYEERLKIKRKLVWKGTIKYKVEVGDNGNIKRIEEIKNTLHDPFVEACLYWNLMDTQLSGTRKGRYTVPFNIDFTPKMK